jgi:hypothetical protein
MAVDVRISVFMFTFWLVLSQILASVTAVKYIIQNGSLSFISVQYVMSVVTPFAVDTHKLLNRQTNTVNLI